MADVRVLVVVDAEPTVRHSAMALAAGRSAGPGKAPRTLPEGVKVDRKFSAVPISRIGFSPQLAMASAAKSRQFVVRGTMSEEAFKKATAESRQAEAAGRQAKVFADPRISTFPSAPGCTAGPVGSTPDVAQLLGVGALAAKGLDGTGVAVAVMDTGINLAHLRSKGLKPVLDAKVTWSPAGGKPGKYPTDHGTMCAYDALIAAPKATLYDFPILLSTTPGGSSMDGFLSDALQAYGVLLALLQKPAAKRPFSSLVISNSWGMYHPSWDFPKGHPGRYADNPNHPFNVIVATLARSGADILFAAGNCGAECPDGRCEGVVKQSITGANAHPDVITVAGTTVKRQRVGYSSQGPGIKGMAHAKPDLAAYTHFLGSEAFGANTEDGGTSTACPVLAGAVAALRTKLPEAKLAPRDLSRELRADARRSGTASWNRNTGYGIVEPLATAKRLGLV